VDEKERIAGNDPQMELDQEGFHDYQRPEGLTLVRPTAGSVPEHLNMSGSLGNLFTEDGSSLNAYAFSETGKFQEDGSFLGKYNQPSQRRLKQPITTDVY
jgi:hypothetical protein